MKRKLPKVAIIGSGNVGANAALFTALAVDASITLVDIVEGLAAGRALDISQALAILGRDSSIEGSDNFAAMAGAKIVVVTAGVPRAPGMSRTDLLQKNASIIKSATAQIKEHAPDAMVIVVTNPLDAMAHLAQRELGFAPERVFGMGGLLDSGRFTHFLSRAAALPPSGINAIVIGSHGDEMVPVAGAANAAGAPFSKLIGEDGLAAAVEKTRHGGAEIVGLLKKGSAAYGPGAAISLMVEAILKDQKRVFSVCVRAAGEYGRRDIYLNLPAILGAAGVEAIIELDLSADEEAALERSAAAVGAMVAELENV